MKDIMRDYILKHFRIYINLFNVATMEERSIPSFQLSIVIIIIPMI